MSGRPSISVRKRGVLEKLKSQATALYLAPTPAPVNRVQRRTLAKELRRVKRAGAIGPR